MPANDDFGIGKILEGLRFVDTSAINPMLQTMVRNAQVNILKQMRKSIDDAIRRMSSEPSHTDSSMDPYRILGVSPNATRPEVERAYRAKAARAHPDKGGSNNDMVLINAAYEAIKQLRGWK